MALSNEHIPFSHSLRERVTRDFAPADSGPQRGDALSRDTLVSYLARSRDTDGSPLATIKRRAAKDNRSAVLRPEDHATLAWVCEAFSEWTEQYPLEEPLSDHISKLLPLAVAVALSDEDFFTPGIHPLHQLFDALHSGAVGWQVRLDRAGQMLEQRVERAVEKALEWFRNPLLDISSITRELEAANERDAARAQRMVQRLAETEDARLKTLGARRDAAEEINTGLARFELPSAIGEFVKGAWYDSAQLVLVKFGAASREWEQMKRTTRHLLESVQPQDLVSEADEDRHEQLLRHLPGELRRWLLSLAHDSDATDGAIGLVEYAHLRIRHGQVLDLTRVAPIAVEDPSDVATNSDDETFEDGSWYRFEDDEGELRAQLVLQLENDQHLLFANFVGLKALDLSRRAFLQRLRDGFALPLPCSDSFSLSLATAVGIDSDERMHQFLDPDYVPAREAPAPPADEPIEQPPAGQHEEPAGAAGGPPETDEQPQTLDIDEPMPVVDSADTVAIADSPRPEAGDPPGSDSPDSDPVLAPPEGAEVAPVSSADDAPREPAAPPAQPDAAGQWSAEPHPAPSSTAPTPATPPAAPEYAPQSPPAAPAPPIAPPPAATEPAPPPPPVAPPVAPAAPPTPPTGAPEPEAAPASADSREVEVPMGAWLGFHDGETPIMAKLAVFDPRRDNYIFVNRKGIAMRELSRAELRGLMDQGLVDILETRCYFRDEVERARGEEP